MVETTSATLSSEIIERIDSMNQCMLLGIPTRGVYLAEVIAKELFSKLGKEVKYGSLDPTLHRDDLDSMDTRIVQKTYIPKNLDESQIIIVDDVIYTGRTIRAALEALHAWGRPKKVLLLTMIDRGHREVPIQPDFCGRKVPTSRSENIQLRLNGVDKEEGVFLQKSNLSS